MAKFHTFPKPKLKRRRAYDYEAADRRRITDEALAAEFAELRTRTPGNRG